MLAPRFALFRLLDGLAAFYKPPNANTDKLISFMKRQLSKDFNALPEEPPSLRVLLRPSENNSRTMTLVTVPDIVDSKLVVGRTFYPGDFMIYPIDPLDDMASGVQDGALRMATRFEQFSWLKTYHLTGMLGRASVDGTPLGATLLRSSWRHVTRQKLDRVLAGLQAQCRSSALLQAGLRPNSQTAYLALANRIPGQDLRSSTPAKRMGDLHERDHLLPPWERYRSLGAQTSGMITEDCGLDAEEARRQKAPCVHSIKCIQFEPPYFTLEVQVSCETFSFLIDLVANLGPRLRSTTLLSRARRVRHGRITAEHALLFKQCRIPDHLITRLNDYVRHELENVEDQPANDRFSESSGRSDILNAIVFDHDCTESPNLFTSLQICSKLGISEAPSNQAFGSQPAAHLSPV
ncbi:putative tRNA pseudouridine synthase [Fasciola hepatica]|uniref:tRNA pseudouridine synthase n=1 Tax=Fasciola hepatica TaxID=6192 RepID=A0A4E0R8I7_FASHE|nr:putative tRNA pseudouridine synthase [Fasciola hepatica]